MRFIYPAIIHPVGDGNFTAKVPDLEGCTAEGFNIDDVMEEINHAMLEWITLELEDNDTLPRISEPEDLKDQMEEGDFIRNVSVIYRMTDGWDE